MYEVKQYTNDTWSSLSGQAKDIAVGPDGALFIIDNSSPAKLKKYTNGTTFIELSSAPSDPQRIEVDKLDELWVMNNKGEIYSQRDDDWIYQGRDAKDIGIGSDGTLWYLTANGEPLKME